MEARAGHELGKPGMLNVIVTAAARWNVPLSTVAVFLFRLPIK